MKKKLLIFLIINLILLSSAQLFLNININVSGSNIYVDKNGEQNYTNIQKAIDDASDGDTIYVNSGVYYENININKKINLIGEGKGISIINANNSEQAIYVSTNNITIQDFTIKNSKIGITLKNSFNITIKENTIQQTDIGININNSSNNIIYSNNFINNTINAYDEYNNSWYNIDLKIGNYWSNYNKTDIDNNGIADTSYNISGGNNEDKYPLMLPITKKPHTSFTYTPLTPTTQQTVQFNDTSYDIDGHITSWLWDFGDQNTSTLKNPNHRYIDNGIYTITLHTKDDLGITNYTIKSINVLNVKPTANIDYTPKTPNDLQNISFIDNSYDVDGYIISWLWDFGDQNTSTLKNPNHRYIDNGIYTIKLTVTDDDQDKTTIPESITVLNVKPIANFRFTPYKPTINDTIEFTDSSTDPDGTIVSWNWDLGDGTTSNQPTINHKFNEGHTYKITLKVVDDDGDSDTYKINIAVSDLTSKTPDYRGFIVVFIVFIVLFSIMMFFVVWIRKKEK